MRGLAADPDETGERVRLTKHVITDDRDVTEPLRKEVVSIDRTPTRRSRTMEIPKTQVLDLIKQHGGKDKADQAEQELPEKVDPDRDSGLLSKFGVEPKDLLAKVTGGKIPGL